MKLMTDAQYVEAMGRRCPHCNSVGILPRTTLDTAVAAVAWQVVICVDCGSTWADRYALTGYLNLEIPHEVPAK